MVITQADLVFFYLLGVVFGIMISCFRYLWRDEPDLATTGKEVFMSIFWPILAVVGVIYQFLLVSRGLTQYLKHRKVRQWKAGQRRSL